MRRWFELGENDDTTYSATGGDRQFLQLPQKDEFIAWANSMVGVICRFTTKDGDSTLCDGFGANPGDPHVIHNIPPCILISVGAELRSCVLFGQGPVTTGLVRQYFEKPGVNDGPNESQTVEKPRGGSKSGGGTLTISLKSYLLLLLATWQGVASGTGGKVIVGTGGVPQRWIEWLTLLISHYDRYTPTQIYGFLARVDFAGPTFKV
jgi:hypothetical protein